MFALKVSLLDSLVVGYPSRCCPCGGDDGGICEQRANSERAGRQAANAELQAMLLQMKDAQLDALERSRVQSASDVLEAETAMQDEVWLLALLQPATPRWAEEFYVD